MHSITIHDCKDTNVLSWWRWRKLVVWRVVGGGWNGDGVVVWSRWLKKEKERKKLGTWAKTYTWVPLWYLPSLELSGSDFRSTCTTDKRTPPMDKQIFGSLNVSHIFPQIRPIITTILSHSTPRQGGVVLFVGLALLESQWNGRRRKRTITHMAWAKAATGRYR